LLPPSLVDQLHSIKRLKINTVMFVTLYIALPFTLKRYLKAKEELWKLKYFTMQKYNLQKNPLKRNQNPSRCHNSITNLKFQH
jgi:hypothetical protein